eukprot:COSAG06_NODE_3665_length_5045_cov_3.720784_2_plen_98_part_00
MTAEAATEFLAIIRNCIAEAGGRDSLSAAAAPPTDAELARRVIGHLTVTPGMEVLVSNEVPPAMFQNKFVLVSGKGEVPAPVNICVQTAETSAIRVS